MSAWDLTVNSSTFTSSHSSCSFPPSTWLSRAPEQGRPRRDRPATAHNNRLAAAAAVTSRSSQEPHYNELAGRHLSLTGDLLLTQRLGFIMPQATSPTAAAVAVHWPTIPVDEPARALLINGRHYCAIDWLGTLHKQELVRQSLMSATPRAAAAPVPEAQRSLNKFSRPQATKVKTSLNNESARNKIVASSMCVHHHPERSLAGRALSSTSSSVSSSPSSSRSGSIESVDLSLLAATFIRQPGAPLLKENIHSISSRASSSSSANSSASSFDDDFNQQAMATIAIDEVNAKSRLSRDGINEGALVAGERCNESRRARKKDQNRRAAYNYRRKKMEERGRMIEDEARLVHRHVKLTGKIARLEEKILTLLRAHCCQISNANNNSSKRHSCPLCMESCDNIQTLRNHLRVKHCQQFEQPRLEIESENNSDNNEDAKVQRKKIDFKRGELFESDSATSDDGLDGDELAHSYSHMDKTPISRDKNNLSSTMMIADDTGYGNEYKADTTNNN